MYTHSFISKFQIGDFVYHCTNESPRGKILDISHSTKFGIKYKVVWSAAPEDAGWYEEDELSDTISF